MNDRIAAHVEKLTSEGLIGVAEASRFMGVYRSGRPGDPTTRTRWCLDGIKLPDGTRLRLDHIRVSDRVMTTKAALLRFLAAQQDPASIGSAARPRSPAERSRAHAKADAALTAAGV